MLHRRIPYNPPPKRWRAHSHKPRLLEPESSRTPRAKPPCRPAPDVRRAMWQRRRQEKQRLMRRIIVRILLSPSWAARSHRIRSRNRPYIPNQNPIRAAAHRYRIMLARFRSVRQEKRQAKIRRAVPVSQPSAQENRITAAMRKDGRCRASLRSSAAPLCSRLIHNAEHPEWQLLQMQCRTILFCRLPLRAIRHSLSAAQEYQVIRPTVKYEMRKRNLRSSAVPLCRLQTWRVRSQQQNIRPHLLLRDPVWQEIRLCRTAAYSQHPYQAVRQENSQILIPHPPAIPQELVRGRSNQAARRIRQYPVQQEHSARPSAGVIPSPCSRRRAFPRMAPPRLRSRTTFLPSNPTAWRSQATEPAWMAALQTASVPHPQRRYLRQCRLPTAKLVRLRAQAHGLMRRVRRNSALRSAQFPHKAAAQKSHRKLLRIRLPLLPNGRAGNRRPRLLWAA